MAIYQCFTELMRSTAARSRGNETYEKVRELSFAASRGASRAARYCQNTSLHDKGPK